jgi:hypothetical protein
VGDPEIIDLTLLDLIWFIVMSTLCAKRLLYARSILNYLLSIGDISGCRF